MTIMTNAEFESLLARAEQTGKHMQSEGLRLISTVRQVTHPLGVSLGGPRLDALLIWLDSKIRTTFCVLWKTYGPMPGMPWTLWLHGSDWSGPPVAGRVSQQVGTITLDGMLSDDYWQGRAAEAYRSVLPRQKDALAAIVSHAQTIDDVLTMMAIAVGALWLSILTCIIAAVVEYTAAAAAAATVVGAGPAAGAGVTTTVKFLASVAAVLEGFYAVVATMTVPVIKDLYQELNDGTAFPEGKWPEPSATVTSDSRLLDGDGLDWQIKAGH
jgi:hypothetical protein